MQDLTALLFYHDIWLKEELSEENWIKNAIAMSLFSDQRVEEIPAYEVSHRGYWADSLDPQAQPLGSRLWTLANQPLNEESLEDAIQYSYESLSWLLDEDVITELKTDGELSKGTILLFIGVVTKKKNYNFSINLNRGIDGIF